MKTKFKNYQEANNLFTKLSNEKKAKFYKKIVNSKLMFYGLDSKQMSLILSNYCLTSGPLDLSYELSSLIFNSNIDELSDNKKILEYYLYFLKYVDNWAFVDMILPHKKFKKITYEEFNSVRSTLLDSNHEFMIRAGYISYILTIKQTKHYDEIFDSITKHSHSEYYYVVMGLAWLLSEMFIFSPIKVLNYILESNLSSLIKNKAIQKIKESRRTNNIQKLALDYCSNYIKYDTKNNNNILGKTNLRVNKLALGGIPLQRVDDASLIIEAFVASKGNFIDTAKAYTSSEALIGKAISGYREKVIISTKSLATSYEKMGIDVEDSLVKLQTSYIDLYQFHNCKSFESYNLLKGAYEKLSEYKKRGIIKHIGITSHNMDFLYELINSKRYLEYEIETVQIPHNILELNALRVIKRAVKEKLGILIMKPLAGGNLSSEVLNYLICNKDINLILVGMDSVKQVEENFSVLKSNKHMDFDYYFNTIEKLDNDFCRRCEYCMPCIKNIDISMCLLIENYYRSYKLYDWAKLRYNNLSVKPDECEKCGQCENKCPYGLKIMNKLERVVEVFKK